MADMVDKPAGEGSGSADEGAVTASVREAARLLGVSDRTVRRRIQDNLLPALKHETEHGYEWRIPLASITAQGNGTLPRHAGPLAGSVQGGGTPSEPSVELLRALELLERVHAEQGQALELVDRLQRENQQLAGQLGFMQAQLQQAQEQIRLLSAPKDEPEPAAAPEPAPVQRAPWWKRLFS